MDSSSISHPASAGPWKAFTSRMVMGVSIGNIIGSFICIGLALWLARTLRVPADVGYAGSVLQQHGVFIAIGVIWIAIIAGALLAAIANCCLQYDAGLFCAGIGVTALS